MKGIKTAVLLFGLLTLLTGVVYPMTVTIVAQLIFPQQSRGSLVFKSDGTAIGSALICQPFSDPKYFWPRPSATTDFPCNTMASGGSNLGPTNKDLIRQVAERVKPYRDTGIKGVIPSELAMASGSGLDPHISPDGAILQIPRIALERHINEEKVKALVVSHIEDRQFGFLGAPRVNVMKLNLALDRL